MRKVFVLPAAPKEVLAAGLNAINTENARNRSTAPLQQTAGGTTICRGRDTGDRLRLRPGRRGPLDPGRGHGLRTGGPALDPLAALFLRPARLRPPCAWGRALPPPPPNTCSAREGGFKDAIQTTADGLDVIIAPPESTAYAAAVRDGEQAKIHDLVNEAYHHHYAAILLDLPSDESAWMLQPLRVANTIVLVSRPTTEGVRACRARAQAAHRGGGRTAPLRPRCLLHGA